MNVAVRIPTMTREAFFDWAEAQDERYEFDGFRPVAMTGGSRNHNTISLNVCTALRTRLRGGPCRAFGMDMGVSTVGDTVRYPDALVTCSAFDGKSRVALGVIAVFEVLSPSSGSKDRVTKFLEYRAVPSIQYYVILEHAGMGLTAFSRQKAGQDWTAIALTADETLVLPSVGITIPVKELYEDVEFAPGDEATDGR